MNGCFIKPFSSNSSSVKTDPHPRVPACGCPSPACGRGGGREGIYSPSLVPPAGEGGGRGVGECLSGCSPGAGARLRVKLRRLFGLVGELPAQVLDPGFVVE